MQINVQTQQQKELIRHRDRLANACALFLLDALAARLLWPRAFCTEICKAMSKETMCVGKWSMRSGVISGGRVFCT